MKKYLFSMFLILIFSNNLLSSENDFEIKENDFKKNINALSTTSYKKDNINFSAQNINFNLKDDTITATGNVTFISEGSTITSDTLHYNPKDDLLYMKGNIVFVNEDNNKVYSSEAILDPKLNTGIMSKFKTLFADKSTMTAETVDKKNADTYNMNKMSFTACRLINNYKPTWQLKAKKAVYNETESDIYLYNAWLEVKGVPIIWTPYFSFSNLDFIRKFGLLTPSYENNSLYGYTGMFSLYVPFGNSQDLLIETHAFLDSNPLFIANYQGFIENGTFNSSFSFVNKQFNKREIDKINRWHFFFDTQKNLTDTWRASLKIEETSDDSFLRNYNLNKKDTAESFYVDKIELEGFFNNNSYFDTYLVKFETINDNFNLSSPVTAPIKHLNNTFNMNYSYFSDYSLLGKINLLMNADNLFKNEKDTLSRFTTNLNYKYYTPTIVGNYTFDLLLQNTLYSDALSENKFVEDNSSSNLAVSATYERPFLYEVNNNFVYSISPIVQVSYAKNLDKNKNSFLLDSYKLNINSNNLFELDHFQGFDQFEESRDLKYAIKFSMLNDTNQGSRIFIGQRFKTGLQDNFISNINEDSASNYFVSFYLYPTSNIYLIYNGVVDKDFNQVETSFSTGYNNNLFAVGTTFDNYNQLDNSLYNLEKISELRLNGAININENFRFNISNLYDVNSYRLKIKTSNFNLIWSNECLELILYNKVDFYTKENPNTWGFKVNIKSIDGYQFTM